MFGHKLIPLSAGHFVGATCDVFLLSLPVGAPTHPPFSRGTRVAGIWRTLPEFLCMCSDASVVIAAVGGSCQRESQLLYPCSLSIPFSIPSACSGQALPIRASCTAVTGVISIWRGVCGRKLCWHGFSDTKTNQNGFSDTRSNQTVLKFLCHSWDRVKMCGAGSCLVLKGNGADVAMHCVPPVSAKRISITLRRCTMIFIRRPAVTLCLHSKGCKHSLVKRRAF